MKSLKDLLIALWGWIRNLFAPLPPPSYKVNKTALLFAINDYAGFGNDLNGCLNDQDDIEAKLTEMFDGEFHIKKFRDKQVTRSRFVTELDIAVSQLLPDDILFVHYSGHGTQVYDKNGDEMNGYDEALYLYDGPLVDDDINAILQGIPDGGKVIIALDSCFSGSATKAARVGRDTKNRFLATPGYETRRFTRKRILKDADMKWIAFSGCGEFQTSADAYIAGKYNGAFTYYALKSLSKGMTYQGWINKIRTYLPNWEFDQKPEMEGNSDLFNDRVFE